MGAIPGLGSHTDAVLRELGFDEEQIAVLYADGSVGPVSP